MNEDLRKWFSQNWVDISRKKKGGGHPPCGASADKGVRAKDSSKKYPKCVPANKAKNMSKKQKKSAVTRKRRAPNEPGSPDNVRTDVKKESWENWKPKSKEVYSSGLPSNNAPKNSEPMAGAVAYEQSRKKVLAQLKEVIRYIIMQEVTEPTIKSDVTSQIPEYNPQGFNLNAKLPVNQLSSDKKPLENPSIARQVSDFARNFMWISYKIYDTQDGSGSVQLQNFKKIFREAEEEYAKYSEPREEDGQVIKGEWIIPNPYVDAVAEQLVKLTDDQISNLEQIINNSKDISDVKNIRNFLETKVYPRRAGFKQVKPTTTDVKDIVSSYKDILERGAAPNLNIKQSRILSAYLSKLALSGESAEEINSKIKTAIGIESGKPVSNPEYETYRKGLNEMINVILEKVLVKILKEVK